MAEVIRTIDDTTTREVINLATLVAESALDNRWSDAHNQAQLLVAVLDGREHTRHWKIRVAVASATRSWFSETVIAAGTTQQLACIAAAASTRIEHGLDAIDTVTTTILGPAE